MIVEKPVIGILAFEIYYGAAWHLWTDNLNGVKIQRGTERSGIGAKVEVGTLFATLVNAGDPLLDPTLAPNMPIRIRTVATNEPIFTGNLVDLFSSYRVNKSTGQTDTFVTISAVDAVQSHSNVRVERVVTIGGPAYESWANRIARLADLAVTVVTDPADDAPIVRYAIG